MTASTPKSPTQSGAKSPITTHVLDVAIGKPAKGVPISLARLTGRELEEIASGETDADGRHMHLLAPGSLLPGVYRIRFDVATYFEESQRASFYPYVEIVFTITQTDEHYHVPLLVSPYGYSTYRGS